MTSRAAAWVLGCVFLIASAAHAQNWKVFRSDKFGFAMLVAPGTTWEAQDGGNGWGGVHAKTGVVEFVGIVKVGTFATLPEMQAFAINTSGIPGNRWTEIDRGGGQAGWRSYNTYVAEGPERFVIAVLGVGQRGSYVLFLNTTKADYAANQGLYKQWYSTLTVF